MMRRETRTRLVGTIAGLTMFVAACGGDDVSTDGVASVSNLQSNEIPAADAVETSSGEITAEEAGLAVSACMRDKGWDDFPDPIIGDNGQPNLQAAIAQSGLDFADSDFRTEVTECRDEVGADSFGAGGRGDVREQIQENLLLYTQCLRDEGLDVGDLGAPGQGQQGNGQGAAGRARGGGGSTQERSARLAEALGLDAQDPETALALEACDDVLVEAFAGAPGAGGTPPPASDN